MLSVEVDISIDENAPAKVRRGVNEFLLTGAQKGHSVAVEKAPVDKGELQDAILQNDPTLDPQQDRVQWGVRGIPQAAPMEWGTEPGHQPPLQPLLEWSERVTGDTGLGYYVALKKIPEEGVSSHPYMRPGRDAQVSWYEGHDIDSFVSRQF